MPDAPRTPHPAADPWFARLRPHRSEDETLDLLLAEAASQLGCGVAAILMVREQTRELEYSTVTQGPGGSCTPISPTTTSCPRSRQPT